MKGDIYYLVNEKDGTVDAKFELTDDYCTGVCWGATSWSVDYKEVHDWEFFAEAYLKWDGCTHWWFKGEDYDPDQDIKRDSYYHLCGAYCMVNHISYMAFVWRVAEMVLNEVASSDFTREYTTHEYHEHEKLEKIIEIAMNGYVIRKESANAKND